LLDAGFIWEIHHPH
jgi:hypothetical protein